MGLLNFTLTALFGALVRKTIKKIKTTIKGIK